MKPLLRFDQASLCVGEKTLLAPLVLALSPGEMLGIAGPNGAGKSTLLRLACGEYRPSSGCIELRGQDLRKWVPNARAKQVAFLPQTSSLQFDFTVRQLVSLGRTPHKDLGGAGEGVIDRVLDDCDLRALAARSYPTLSGGEQQRAQLARVLAQVLPNETDSDLSGQLLLLDEPTAALDIPHQQRMLRQLAALRDRGCGIVLILHDLNILSRQTDRLLFLKQGEALAQGTTKELLREDTLSTLYDYPLKLSLLDSNPIPFVHTDD
ncbi:MAG: iron complex transport system ATP-binding protein [Halieaceae bacterium]